MRIILCDSQTVAYGTSSISINEKPVRNADSQALPSCYWIWSSRVSSSIRWVVLFLNFFWEVYTLWNFWQLSVQFSQSVMSDSLWNHGLQHARLPSQTHVHWVSEAIQPSHPLSSPSPAFNPSQHQGLFQWVSSSLQVAKVLEFQLQHQSFQWTFRTDFL